MHMDLHILENIFVIFTITIGIVLACHFIKIPFLIGYLVAGIILSPYSTGLLKNADEIGTYAEIGVILLLFTVGLEFSFSNLRRLKKYVLLGGFLQVVFTILVTGILVYLMDRPLIESVFWGFVLSLSSTAIVIKILQDTVQLSKEHGKIVLSMLLFQDIAIVPLMLLTPILAGEGDNPFMDLILLVAKLAGMVVIAILLARYLIPRFLKLVIKLQSQEIFLIATIFIVLGVALITSFLGLSLSLGAFLAGLIIAETDYNKLAISCFLPFRYVFISFFFISMGMLLDYHIFIDYPLAILFWFTFILAVKVFAGWFAARTLNVSKRTAMMVGLSIAQIGEFSFILSREGLDIGLISETNYQIFLAVSILTMLVAPYLVTYSAPLTQSLSYPFIKNKAKSE